MNEGDEARIVGELTFVLQRATHLHSEGIQTPHLSAWLEEHVHDRSVLRKPGAVMSIVFAAALSAPKEVAVQGGFRRPLLAAKHLLALGAYNLRDPSTPIEDTALSLAASWNQDGIQAARKHPVEHWGLRQVIAGVAQGSGPSRKNVSRQNGGLLRIANALWASVQELAPRPDLSHELAASREKVANLTQSAKRYIDQREASEGGSGVPSVDFQRLRQRVSVKRLRMVAIAALALSVVTVGTVLVVSEAGKVPATNVISYVPTDTAMAEAKTAEVDAGLQLICAQTSLVSLRKDTQLCLMAGAVLDPCFDAGSERVVCPQIVDSAIAELQVHSVGEVREFAFDAAGLSQQIGLEQAQTQIYPWALVLDQRNPDGRQLECVTAWSDERFELGSYQCNTGVASQLHIVTPDDPDAEIVDLRGIEITTAGSRSAGSLQWDGATGTVQLADTATGKVTTVRVISAWF